MKIYRELKALLTTSERWQMLLLFHLMLVGMILETMGLGLVIASVTMMTQPDITKHYPSLKPVLKFFHYPDQSHLIAGGVLMLVALYVIKTAFLIFMTWKRNNFIYGVLENLSLRLFKGYVEQPWSFHLQRNSAQLIRNVIGEVNFFATNTLKSGLTLLTEGFVFLGIGGMLIIMQPIGAITVLGVLGLASFFFQKLVRHRVPRWGNLRQQHDSARLQHIQQGLGGAKDVKLLGRESNFINQFSEHNAGSVTINKKLGTLLELPRLFLELMAVIGLACMVLTMLAQGQSVEMLIPTIGLFAAAAFRLMPSVTNILASLQTVRFSLPSMHLLYEEVMLMAVNNKTVPISGKVTFNHDIVLNHVSYKYANVNHRALDDISLSIPRGASVGFIGQSGSGKSTLVDVILGLLTPERGTVCIDQLDIQSNLRGWQDQIGYVPQTIFLTDDTLRRNVAFGLPDEQINDVSVRKAIEAAHLGEFIDGLPDGLETFVGERGVRLSGGQRQRIGIARALYHDPDILVLDEATSSLDSTIESEVMNDINALQGKKTLIIVAHRLSTIKNCSWIYRIEQGKIVDQGSFMDVINRNSAPIDQEHEFIT